MALSNFLNKVRSKPESWRHGLALALAAVFTLVIFAAWVSTLSLRHQILADQSGAQAPGPLDQAKVLVGNQLGTVGLGAQSVLNLIQQR